MLVNPNYSATVAQLRDVPAWARSLGLRISLLSASSARETGVAMETLARERPDALFSRRRFGAQISLYFPTFCGDAAIQSFSAQSGHSASPHTEPGLRLIENGEFSLPRNEASAGSEPQLHALWSIE